MRGAWFPLKATIHEDLSIVMCYCYSQNPLSEMMEAKFSGDWKFLRKTLFETSALRAERALLELALLIRMVDDEEKITEYDRATNSVPSCGKLIMRDGSIEPLPFREVANKVIHSVEALEWKYSPTLEHQVVCHAGPDEKWVRAEIGLVDLSFVCGRLPA
jgi:hypothetical protein